MHKTRCIICNEEKGSLEVNRDLVTGFYFCMSCGEEVQKEFESLCGTRKFVNWLRAIANVMDRRRG